MEAPGHESVIDQVKEVLSRPVDESQPYKHWYDASDLLQTELDKLRGPGALRDGTSDPEGVAWLMAQQGLCLLETDLRHQGEACILAALPRLELRAEGAGLPGFSPSQSTHHEQQPQSAPTEHLEVSGVGHKAIAVLQRCYNALGALWSERGELESALMWLNKAERLYHGQRKRVLQQKGENKDSLPSPPGSGAEGAGQADPAYAGDVLEAGYTLTVFSLAQVHAHAGSKEQSALYCAATLQRQLASGEVQLSEWVQNCLQLSAYYVNASAFAIGQYLLDAVQRIAQVEAEKKRQALDASDGQATGGEAWTRVLDEDVAANVHLAWGKLYLYRLVASLAYMQQSGSQKPSLPYPSPEHFPDLLRFPSLSHLLPSPEELPWGVSALATTFEAARDLFNAAIPRFNAALEYYKLDGWVTEYVTTQLEVSNLYRVLAAFEQDPKRCAAMHKLRASRLAHLVGALNPQHYLGLSRSIDLETANAWRDHVDALTDKLDSKAPNKSSKAIAEGARAATHSYTRFLNSFRKEDAGQMPDRIDADNEHFFLMAAFNLGRVLHRSALRVDQHTSESDLDIMVQAYKHLHWIADYVRRHKIEKMKQEASMAEQLASLIAEKIDLSKKVASMPKK
ncbi:KIF-1 binding protein C terminal-domain-containing protein [Dunaliella salina]|uniref:KIF-binding protein n=1 Tax=Dunaliella salina TaxID=3046 RepID=A0ABQ7GGE4_DUNSA|nr:KIF-1 binding protein C terminal-domain-containing protein [Dunaliella salina]|eukprot:KAF5833677.1 KIF-1 binding protein C terminal-domain-containing protein [Dunaliella salina]